MKNPQYLSFTKILSFFIVLLSCSAANRTQAQSLPTIQKTSVFAPRNIKIDGKSNEWDNKFQAKNNATEIFYTIANDHKNLYFIIKAVDPVIVKKILGGGMSYTVNNSGRKEGKGNITLSFPRANSGSSAKVGGLLQQIEDGPNKTDSLILAMNDELVSGYKEIKVNGFKDIADTSISIYNEEGFKTAMRFDNKKALTCEIAIPLKCLGLSSDSESKIIYNIMLSGILKTMKMVPRTVGGGQQVMMFNVSAKMISNTNDFQTLNYPTDFWGDYTLAREGSRNN